MSEDNRTTGEEEIVEEGVIQLIDDDGNEVNFEVLMTFDHENQFYVSLLPVEELEGFEDGEVLLMRIDEDEDGESLTFSPIETEEELNAVWEVFIKLYEDDDEETEEEDEE